ncbi:TonB-dependent receptor [Novosphingobium sp.]|uniref:TonB-dependent receptor n=1 Tax=Novosphingobium sp. TaxID=1874826 RepID=UPI0038B7189B
MRFGFLGGCALVAIAASAPQIAYAQQTSAAPASEAAASGVDDIVVTAQRRVDTVQNTAIALTAITGDELARRGLTNVNQLQDTVPSLEVVPAFGGGQPQFRLRGVGFDDYATNNASTVGVYVDDVAYPVPVTTQSALFDIERVEVLRGPQGTLYGRNTTGGAINFISRKPTAQLSAGVNLEYGRYDQFKGEAFVSGPLSDTLRFRVAAITEQGGGFQTNRTTGQSLGDANRVSAKGTLEWKPSATATISLNVHGGYDKSQLTGLYLFKDFTTHGYGLGTPGLIPADTDTTKTGWGFSPTFAALAGVSSSARPLRNNVGQGGSLNAAIDLTDNVRLTSISAYDYYRRRELQSWDASNANESELFWKSDVYVFSQEVRLSSTQKSALNWVAGAYYSNQVQHEGFLSDFTNSLGFIVDTHYRQKVQSISGFGQVSYDVTPKLTLVGGLRYEHETRKLRDFGTSIGPVTTFTNGNRDTGLDEVSGKAGLEFRPQKGLLLYANVSRGVKSGGFTVYNSPNSNQIDPFKPEVLYAYEVGVKADIGPKLRIDASAFYYDYRDQQVLGTVLSQQSGLIGRITNAPKSKIWGGEVEVVLAPVQGLKITQSVGYKYGEYSKYEAIDPTSLAGSIGNFTATTIDQAGKALPIARWSYQGSVAYTVPLGGYALEAAGDYAFRDKLPSFLGATYDLDKRWIANATLTLRPEQGNWSIGLYGRNIFNEKYDLVRNYFLPNAKVAQPGRPATYGVQLGYHF